MKAIKPIPKVAKRPRYKREKRIVREVLCVKICLDKREVCNLKTTLGRAIYKERTELMAERQNWICGCGCGRSMTDSGFSGATFDHSEGRGMSGGIGMIAWKSTGGRLTKH